MSRQAYNHHHTSQIQRDRLTKQSQSRLTTGTFSIIFLAYHSIPWKHSVPRIGMYILLTSTDGGYVLVTSTGGGYILVASTYGEYIVIISKL